MAHRLGAAGLLVGLLGSAAQAEPVCMEAVLQGGAGTMPLVVEVVSTEADRAKGLMFVEHMPLNRGMLFVFEEPDRHGFWMHNTLIPLDIVPLAEDGTILETLNGVPHSTDTLVPATPVLRMLEVNAGLIATMEADNGQGRFVLTGGTACDAEASNANPTHIGPNSGNSATPKPGVEPGKAPTAP
jgi:uncharacterized protein